MAVFNDTTPDNKLRLFDQRVELNNQKPVLLKGESSVVPIATEEPLRRECQHFLDCIRSRATPLSDATSGLNVLKILQACQHSLQLNGRPISLNEI